jgi:capsular exopolysaccharide synthesis family protein
MKDPKIRVAFTAGRGAGEVHAAGASKKVVEGVPLVKIIKRSLKSEPEIVMTTARRSIHAERYRRLKTTLLHLHPQPHVLVVTSGAPSEGKSTTSMNLALAFAADSGDRTLLIDADLRRPSIGRWIDPEPQIGLAHILRDGAGDEHAILSLEGSSLEVLPAGGPCRDPLDLLGSPRMTELMQRLRARFTRIVIDTPPLIPFTDADAVGALSDGMVIVIRAGETSTGMVKQTIESVTSTRVLGIVLNDVKGRSLADWGKYQGRYAEKYYQAYYEKQEDKK